MVLQLFHDPRSFFASRTGALQHHEGDDRLAGKIVGATHHGSLGDHRIGHQRRLDFHGAHAVTGDVQHVVDATHDREVAGFLVTNGTVAGKIEFAAQFVRVIRLLVALRISPDGPDHRGPGLLDHQDTALAVRHIAAGFVDDIIEPQETRPKVIATLAAQRDKYSPAPPRKPGNIPV